MAAGGSFFYDSSGNAIEEHHFGDLLLLQNSGYVSGLEIQESLSTDLAIQFDPEEFQRQRAVREDEEGLLSNRNQSPQAESQQSQNWYGSHNGTIIITAGPFRSVLPMTGTYDREQKIIELRLVLQNRALKVALHKNQPISNFILTESCLDGFKTSSVTIDAL